MGLAVQVPGSKLLSEGLYVGGSFEGAQAGAFSMAWSHMVTTLGDLGWLGRLGMLLGGLGGRR